MAARVFFGGGREWICSRARGEILEIAFGTDRNLPLYPDDVRLTGIDLSPKMLAVARRRARQERLEDDLRIGDAQDLQSPNASFDGVVAPLASSRGQVLLMVRFAPVVRSGSLTFADKPTG